MIKKQQTYIEETVAIRRTQETPSRTREPWDVEQETSSYQALRAGLHETTTTPAFADFDEEFVLYIDAVVAMKTGRVARTNFE